MVYKVYDKGRRFGIFMIGSPRLKVWFVGFFRHKTLNKKSEP